MGIDGIGSFFPYWKYDRTGEYSEESGKDSCGTSTLVKEQFSGEGDFIFFQAGNSSESDKTEGLEEEIAASHMSQNELMDFLRNSMNHMYLDGSLIWEEPSFQIGANFFTEEEWGEFLERVDAMLESVGQSEEEKEQKESPVDRSVADDIPVESIEETAVKTGEEGVVRQDDSAELYETIVNTAVNDGLALTSETRHCSYPSGKTGEEITYVVCFTESGIVCNKSGEKKAVWTMAYGDEGDYEKVLSFLAKFEEENLRFTAHKRFWQDYLSGEFNEEDFLDFFNRAENGKPDFLLRTESGNTIDLEHFKYQKYFTRRSIANSEFELPDFVGNFWDGTGEFPLWASRSNKNAFSDTSNGKVEGKREEVGRNNERWVPYGELESFGVINYHGVTFVCKDKEHAICLGDMSKEKDVLTIPLSGGGCLRVNKNNIGDLGRAIGMFSAEDVGIILRAIEEYRKISSMEYEMEEMKKNVGMC